MELGMLDYLIAISVFILVLTYLLYYYSTKTTKSVKGEYFPVKSHEQIINQIPTLRKLDSNCDQYKDILGKMIRRNTDWNRQNEEDIRNVVNDLDSVYQEIEQIKACLTDLSAKKNKK